jgi:uncharacterized protein
MATSTTRRSPRIVVRRSPIQGFGVFANRAIRKGTRIIEYKGDRITTAQGDRRYPVPRKGVHHTFLFAIDEDTVIDGNSNGNSARLINHSCAPNCESIVHEDDRVWIYARRNIRKGEELSYDYHMDVPGRITKADLARYPCACGAPRCRGTLIDLKRHKKKIKK